MPRGKCPAFRFQGWNDPRPQSASHYDPALPSATSSMQQLQVSFPDIRVLTAYGVGKVQAVEYEQPQCHGLTLPCFDVQRCTAQSNGGNHSSKQQVYAYPGKAEQDMKAIIALHHPEWLELTHEPHEACLLMVHVDDFNDSVVSLPYWDGGRNHYVYGVTKPIERNVHYGMAAIGSVALTRAQLRMGYDIPLPLPALWKPRSEHHLNDMNNLHRPRRWLVSFKGSIQDTLQPYYQHRWLAAEYWNDDHHDDVAIDVQCKHKGLLGNLVTFAPYDNPSMHHFDDLMVNSTFAFCPGGSHVTSYRFTEVLSTASIPVLLPEIVPPFVPELDWSRCVVWVSQARIVDLPRILRAMSPEQIRARQHECNRLYRLFRERIVESGPAPRAHDQPSGFLSMALKVWKVRLETQQAEAKILEDHFY
jgi:hypothetical protein